MTKILVTESKITAIADAIRTKTSAPSGTTYSLDQMASAIGAITVNGGSSFLSGTDAPTSDIGSDGDYYYQYESFFEASIEYTFQYTGQVQTFTIPTTGNYKLEVYGAKGGDAFNSSSNLRNLGGKGGYSSAEGYFTAGDVLYIVVGGAGQNDEAGASPLTGGYNGGGNSFADEARAARGSGGGASHIALRNGLLVDLENYTSDILIVAGGGGGAASFSKYAGTGGSGGGLTGGDGTGGDGTAGLGGTQSAGGDGYSTFDGSFGQGGSRDTKGSVYGGAGGGGGYYGGGAAGNNKCAGGGSGYLSSSLTNGVTQEGLRNDNGLVVISDLNTGMVEMRQPSCIYQKVNGSWIISGERSDVSLPSGYKRVEYISVTGVEFVTIPHVITTNEYVEAKVILGDLTHTSESAFAGRDGKWELYTNNGKTQQWTSDTTMSLIKQTLVLDAYNIAEIVSKFTSPPSSSNDYFTVGVYRVGSYSFSGKIFGFRMFEILGGKQEDTINLVPCIRMANQQPGFYDIVNDNFYENTGTGTFGVGPIV